MSSAIDPQRATNPKLPLGATIGLSYSTYFHNFVDVLRASWLWLLITAPFTGAAAWMQASWMAGVFADMKQGGSPQTVMRAKPVEMTALTNLANILLLVAGISIAVAWHRRIILDEHPGFSGSNLTTKDFWRYVWVGLAICLVIGVPLLAILLPMFYFLVPSVVGGAGPPAAIPEFGAALSIAAFLLYLTAAAILLRLSLLFPARAAGDVALTFKEAWNRTNGNALRIFWGIAACTVPPMFLVQIAFSFLVEFPRPETFADEAFAEGHAAVGATMMTYYLLIMPIGIGFLSHAYRHFFRPA
jgi:hypothetical protein